MPDAILDRLQAQRTAMLQTLARLVNTESPSGDLPALRACADVLAEEGTRVLGVAPERIDCDGRPHLRWRFGDDARVGTIGHFDTVWPLGTAADRPYAEAGGHATGPGVFDMKAGVVHALYAVAELDNREGVELLFTSDEEIGSPTSEALFADLARRVKAALVLEPSHDGALKIARKGVSGYTIDVHGLSSHAGLEPEKGINALTELGHIVLALEGIADPPRGTTVTPTTAQAGSAQNVVPAEARLYVDVRTLTQAEAQRVDDAIRALRPTADGAVIEVSGGLNRAPMEEAMTRDLFARAQKIAAEIGLRDLRGVTVGGGSDGNFTAALGTPTLDGLGAVGGGAHAEHEYIDIEAMVPRIALLNLLIEDVLAGPH